MFICERFFSHLEDTYRRVIDVDGEHCSIEILDTAGQDEFSSLQDQWMRECNAMMLVYSINSQESFERAQRLRDVIDKVKDGGQVSLVLAGNKSDLETQRKVTAEEGKMFAQQRGMTFFETSAKNNTNVLECFSELIRLERRRSTATRHNRAPRKHFPVRGNPISVCCTLL
jgi:small GTP-binding protein